MPNNLTPKVRFKGYAGAWGKSEFSKVFSGLQNNTLSRAELNYEFGEVKNVHYGDVLIVFGEYIDVSSAILPYINDNSVAKKYSNSFLSDGDIIIADTAEDESVGKCTEIRGSQGFNVLSGLHTIPCRPTDSFGPKYLGYYMNSPSYHDQLLPFIQGIKVSSISKSAIQDTVISYPKSIEEQSQIGALLSNIDAVITLHQQKYDKVKSFKKSLLEKMFPKLGDSTPEIRFEEYTSPWEQHKYSDIATTRRGLTYKPADITDGGKRVLRSSNINEDTFEIHEDDVFVDDSAVNIPYVTNGDILITSANGSSRLVGKHAIIRGIPENSVVHGGFMLLASSKEPDFVNALMGSQWYARFINVYVAGGNGAIGNLNKNDLDEQIVLMPSKSEREKIGKIFANLDNLIALYELKLEKLKNIKSALISKVFI